MQDKRLIQNALHRLRNKIKNLDIEELDISDYNKGYLTKYKNNFDFYAAYYQQLILSLSLNESDINSSTFVDYGGGCGILSYFACELGFENVMYNDLYLTSVDDVKIISSQLGYSIHYFVHGDIQEMADYLKINAMQIDVICSFDVLEHIYDVPQWFEKAKEIPGEWQLAFITSANGANPMVAKRLKKIHAISENIGFEKSNQWKEIDTHLPYLEIRRNLIQKQFPNLEQNQLDELALRTRGLQKEDMYNKIEKYLNTGIFDYKPNHPTNTCDPYTGNWNEHLIDLDALQYRLKNLGYTTQILNTTYAKSTNSLLNLPKSILNTIIGFVPRNLLCLSPMYILKINKL